MTIEGTYVPRGNPFLKAAQDRTNKRSQAEARWNNPETQRIEAERRKLDADKGRASQIDGLSREINRLRIELDAEAKARAAKEAKLRGVIERLAELTGPHTAAEVETNAEEVVADRIAVDEAPRGRGRPPKASH